MGVRAIDAHERAQRGSGAAGWGGAGRAWLARRGSTALPQVRKPLSEPPWPSPLQPAPADSSRLQPSPNGRDIGGGAGRPGRVFEVSAEPILSEAAGVRTLDHAARVDSRIESHSGARRWSALEPLGPAESEPCFGSSTLRLEWAGRGGLSALIMTSTVFGGQRATGPSRNKAGSWRKGSPASALVCREAARPRLPRQRWNTPRPRPGKARRAKRLCCADCTPCAGRRGGGAEGR